MGCRIRSMSSIQHKITQVALVDNSMQNINTVRMQHSHDPLASDDPFNGFRTMPYPGEAPLDSYPNGEVYRLIPSYYASIGSTTSMYATSNKSYVIGCKYKHKIPTDKATQLSLGPSHGIPNWYRHVDGLSPSRPTTTVPIMVRDARRHLGADKILYLCQAFPPPRRTLGLAEEK
jgi:hypothetical protein